MTKEKTRVVIIGCGDIGCRIAKVLSKRDGFEVSGVVRTNSSAKLVEAAGAEAIVADLDRDTLSVVSGLPLRDAYIFYLSPPPNSGIGDTRVEAFLHAIKPNNYPTRVVYMSTTGVYGNCHGNWVSEQTPPQPLSSQGRRRLAAENTLLSWCESYCIDSVILRVPGIYGPGRWPIDKIKRGDPLVHPNDSGYSNRIHAEDLASICIAAMERGVPHSIYNVSDGKPSTMTDYFFQVADAFGLKRPPTVSFDQAEKILSPMMLSYLKESKRVDNRKMLAELGIQLRFGSLDRALPTETKN